MLKKPRHLLPRNTRLSGRAARVNDELAVEVSDPLVLTKRGYELCRRHVFRGVTGVLRGCRFQMQIPASRFQIWRRQSSCIITRSTEPESEVHQYDFTSTYTYSCQSEISTNPNVPITWLGGEPPCFTRIAPIMRLKSTEEGLGALLRRKLIHLEISDRFSLQCYPSEILGFKFEKKSSNEPFTKRE
jgi:hypothetical protein